MMKSYFSSQFFETNRQKLRQAFKDDVPIVIVANGLVQRGADSSYAFSQDANFWYLTGIDEPDLLLVIDSNQEYLIVPSRSGVRETFDGALAIEQLSQRSAIKNIYDDQVGWAKLQTRLKKSKKAVTVAPPPAYVEQYGLYTNPARSNLVMKLQAGSAEVELLDAGQALARLRMIKQPAEIKVIQAAIDITGASLQAAAKPSRLNKYKFEYELEAAIRAGFRSRGASGDSFEPIVAGGKNACTLHNVANNSPFKIGDLILADVGAEVEHYAADITRVYAPTKPTARQRAVYAAVQEVQKFAMSQLKPGILSKEYEQSIEQFMGQQLRQLKLIKDITHDNVRQFYPHSTSHFLGLNVHDIGDYTQPLQAGIVMTVEPGIYIPAEDIGIRLEDDVLITDNGVKVLSKNISSRID
jgi:Xaa-Pro aminopeptidase